MNNDFANKKPLVGWDTLPAGYRFMEKTFYSSAHLGHDHIVPVNTPIYSWGNITVQKVAGNDMGVTAHCTDEYGKFVRIGHCNEVYAGKKKQGDIIGLSGNTGRFTTGPHTHTDVSYKNLQLNNLDNFIDPMIYFKPPMKIKILALNYGEQWITQEVLQPVRDFFPFRIDFDVEYVTDTTLDWNNNPNSNNRVGSLWLGNWMTKYDDPAYDCVAVLMGQKDWKGNVLGSIIGDAFVIIDKKQRTYGICMLAEQGMEHPYAHNKGLSQLVGTLRHEICHVLFYMTTPPDRVHEYDFDKKDLKSIFNVMRLDLLNFKNVQPFDSNQYRGKVIRNRDKPEHYYVSRVTGKVVHIPNEDWFTIGIEEGLWKSWSDAIIIKEDIII